MPKDLEKIAKEMLMWHPRVLEYSLDLFIKAVKAQTGEDLTHEEAIEVGKIIIQLPQQKCDLRYLAVEDL